MVPFVLIWSAFLCCPIGSSISFLIFCLCFFFSSGERGCGFAFLSKSGAGIYSGVKGRGSNDTSGFRLGKKKIKNIARAAAEPNDCISLHPKVRKGGGKESGVHKTYAIKLFTLALPLRRHSLCFSSYRHM